MGDNTLVQALRLERGLRLQRDRTLQDLAENPGFISRFREWEYDPSDFSGIAHWMAWSRPYSELWSFEEMAGGQPFLDILQQSTIRDMRDLYGLYVEAVQHHTKDPDNQMYGLLLSAYITILRRWEQSAKTIGFLEQHVKPHFGQEGYLDRRNLNWIIAQAPHTEYAEVDVQDMAKILQKGITRDELASLVNSVSQRDQIRKRLHQDLLQYAQRVGLAPEEVMVDIVYRLHNTLSSVRLADQRTIVVVGGVLIVGYYDPGSGRTVGEQSFQAEPPQKNLWSHEQWIRDRETAQNILRRWLAGEYVSQPEYKAKLLSAKTHDDVTGVFERIRGDNQDIPITHGFELSHCAHGRVVAGHRLRADISGLHTPQGIDHRLPTFLAYLRQNAAGN